jgi:hypothetical protein
MSAQIQLPDNWRAHIDDAARDCATGALDKGELTNPRRPPLVVVRDNDGGIALLCVDADKNGLYRLSIVNIGTFGGVAYWAASDVIAVGLGDSEVKARVMRMYPPSAAGLVVDACAAWTTIYGILDDCENYEVTPCA